MIPLLITRLDQYQRRDILQGKVVDNKDPLQKSRVKVAIPGISDKIKIEHLPWYPVIQEGYNSHTRIPPIGSRVVIKYMTIYNSLVLGSVVSTTPRI